MGKKLKLPTAAEDRQQKREAAMPEVKRLVKEHGRQTVQWCVNQLHEYDKKVAKLAQIRAEARALARDIK